MYIAYCESLYALQMMNFACPEGLQSPALCGDTYSFGIDCPCRGRGVVRCNSNGNVKPGEPHMMTLLPNTTAVFSVILEPAAAQCPAGSKMVVMVDKDIFHTTEVNVYAMFDQWAWFSKPPYTIRSATLVYPADQGPSPCTPHFITLSYSL